MDKSDFIRTDNRTQTHKKEHKMKQQIWVLLYTPQNLSLKKGGGVKALKQMSRLHESFRIQQQNGNKAVASPKLDQVKHMSPKMSYALHHLKHSYTALSPPTLEYTTNTLFQQKKKS